MANKEVTADNYGLTINHPPEQKYVIGWWQIEQDGFSHWHNQLMEKKWFSDEMSRKFTDLCIEHFNWS